MNDGWNSLPVSFRHAALWRDLKETPPNKRWGREFGGQVRFRKKMCMSEGSFLVEAVFFLKFSSIAAETRCHQKVSSSFGKKTKNPSGPSWWRCTPRQIRANKVKKYLGYFFFLTNIKGPYILKDGTSKLFSSSLFFCLFGSWGNLILRTLLTFLLACFFNISPLLTLRFPVGSGVTESTSALWRQQLIGGFSRELWLPPKPLNVFTDWEYLY